jgi:hypothetical protein
MKRNKAILFMALLGALALNSCSNNHSQVCTTNCSTGTATLSVTMSAVPLAPPPGSSVLSFSVTINGISLAPTGGSTINIPLTAATYTQDMTKLQSDSAFLGQVIANVPAGSYNNVALGVTSASVTFCTQLAPGTPGCANGSITTLSAGVSAPASAISLTLLANEKTGLQLQLNMSNTLTIVPATQVVSAINLTAANVLGAVTLPPSASSLAANQLDFVEDFTGVVTTVTATAVTIQSSEHGTITAAQNSATFYSPNCAVLPLTTDFAGCVQQGQLASMDAALNADGTFTLLNFDPLESTASDWIEGTVSAVPSSSTQFRLVATDLFLQPAGSLIGTNLSVSAPVTVNLAAGATFGVDLKGLTVPVEATTFSSSNDTSVLKPGQTVAIHVTSFTPGPSAVATVDFVGLRFTRVTGSISSVAAPNSFSMQTLPPFFGTTSALLVELNQPINPSTAPTNFDGVADATHLTVGDTVSIRALYFGPASAEPFSAAKVRKH